MPHVLGTEGLIVECRGCLLRFSSSPVLSLSLPPWTSVAPLLPQLLLLPWILILTLKITIEFLFCILIHLHGKTQKVLMGHSKEFLYSHFSPPQPLPPRTLSVGVQHLEEHSCQTEQGSDQQRTGTCPRPPRAPCQAVALHCGGTE